VARVVAIPLQKGKNTMFKFIASVFAGKLDLTREMQNPISTVYATLLREEKIGKDNKVLMQEVAKHVYLSIEPEPQWIAGKNDRLADATKRRREAYQRYAETYNASLKALASQFKKSTPENLPLLMPYSQENTAIFLSMDRKHCALHAFNEKKEAKTRTFLREELAHNNPSFDGPIIEVIMQYAHVPPRPVYGIKEPEEEKEDAGAQDTLYLQAIQAMAGTEAMKIFGPEAIPCWLDAVSRGNREQVEFFLRYGADIEAKDAEGRTPLLLAVSAGHTDIVACLLQEDADTEAENKEGHTPFFLAMRAAHMEIMQRLLKYGVTRAEKDTLFQTQICAQPTPTTIRTIELLLEHGITQALKDKAFLAAADTDNLQVLNLLLRYKVTARTQQQALHSGDLKLVRFLLQKEVTQAEKDTFFMRALKYEQLPVLAFFLEQGITPQTRDQACMALIDRTVMALIDRTVNTTPVNKPIMALLLEFGITEKVREHAFVTAARNEHLELVVLFLQDNCVMQSVRDSVFISVLQSRQFSLVSSFLQRGITPEIEEKGQHLIIKFLLQNFYPYMYQEQKRMIGAFSASLQAGPAKDMILFFLKKGVTPATQDEFLLALNPYQPLLMRLLLQAGVTQAAKDEAFMRAMRDENNFEKTALLLKHGITSAAKNQALIAVAAAEECDMQTAAFLLRQGVTQEGLDQAVVAAAKYGPDHHPIMELLLKKGITDAGRDQAFMRATRYQNKPTMAFFLQHTVTQMAKDKALAELTTRPNSELTLEFLLKEGITQTAKDELLISLVRIKDTAPIIQLFLKHGITPAAKDEALAIASEYKNTLPLIEYLLQDGTTEKGRGKALATANCYKHEVYMKRLLQEGVSQEVLDETLIKTVLRLEDYHYQYSSPDHSKIALLLQYGVTQAAKDQAFIKLAAIHKTHNVGTTLVFLLQQGITQTAIDQVFMRRSHSSMWEAKRFLDCGITPEVKNQAFLQAVCEDDLERVALFLEHNITQVAKDKALCIAIQRDWKPGVTLLLKKGAIQKPTPPFLERCRAIFLPPPLIIPPDQPSTIVKLKEETVAPASMNKAT
jgi:ankyrin repeat protein